MKHSKKPWRHPRSAKHPRGTLGQMKNPRDTLGAAAKKPLKTPSKTPLEYPASARVKNVGVTLDTKKPATTNAVTGYMDANSFDGWLRTIIGWLMIVGLAVLAWMTMESAPAWHGSWLG